MNWPIRTALLSVLLCVLPIPVVRGQMLAESRGLLKLAPHGPREFVLDEASLLDPATKNAIREQCDKLLTDKATPIVVVTIPSMAQYGGRDLRIETFARLLFDQWQVGIAKLGNQNWTTGILLLVSSGDRKTRIELGAGWSHDKDAQCQQIMDQYIVPRFKQGDYAGGITAGVQALDAMARDKPMPTVPRPWWHLWVALGAFGLAIFTAVSLVRRGSSGWAWLIWGVVFSVVGYMLYSMLTRSSSGGYGGGSFGGGFSGGGGASGSW